MMTWSTIDSSRFDSATASPDQGDHVLTLKAPYEVPEAIRAYRKKDTQELVIDLRYLGEEQTKSVVALAPSDASPSATVDVGINSGRVYQVHIQNLSPSKSLIGNVLDSIIQKLTELAGDDHRRSERYRLTGDVLKASGEIIMAAK
ncbi:MAG: hypothetical protein JNN07_03010 [Verrucomicrobiales bacterium]|nr:hypothetical protein [Verrucomicrobiales bacterium]